MRESCDMSKVAINNTSKRNRVIAHLSNYEIMRAFLLLRSIFLKNCFAQWLEIPAGIKLHQVPACQMTNLYPSKVELYIQSWDAVCSHRPSRRNIAWEIVPSAMTGIPAKKCEEKFEIHIGHSFLVKFYYRFVIIRVMSFVQFL